MMSERDADKLWGEMNAPGGPCGVCGVEQEDHGHRFDPSDTGPLCFLCGGSISSDPHTSHDWEPPSDNAPDEPEED